MYYVIQVKTGKEEKAISAIKKQLAEKDGFDIFTPSRMTLRKYHGEFKEVEERCFPGYIFVETDKPKDLFFDLYWTPEYTKLLGREGLTYNFLPLNKDEARMVDILYNANNDRKTPISDIEVVEGQKIRVIAGPLMGQEGLITKVNLHKRTVTIKLSIFKREAEVDVGINIIGKIEEPKIEKFIQKSK